MKRILNIITVVTAFLAVSCAEENYTKEANYDLKTNYEAFWKLVNENYCFLGNNYGYTKNIDWEKVYDDMMPRVEAAETEEELLDIMGESIDVLKDGHVWIDTRFNHRGCYTFYNDENGVRYPDNFISGLIQEKYLVYPYRTRNGHRYGVIKRGDKTFFYLHHADFLKGLNEEDLEMFQPHIDKADGFIYDLRTNSGGSVQQALKIAGRFVKEKTLVGYNVAKTGKGYDDVSEPSPLYIVPNDEGPDWSDIKTVLLTNRDVYSAANMFTSFMKVAPNVTVIGGISGGGGGLPTTYYLPNGWAVTMSAQKMSLDLDKVHIEGGVKPDIEVNITETDIANKVDSILERAMEELSK
jgi:hypothetical protein